jgi:hypothetical protein
MMDDMLVEIDTRTLKVARHFIVTKGLETGINARLKLKADINVVNAGHEGYGRPRHGTAQAGENSCSPT